MMRAGGQQTRETHPVPSLIGMADTPLTSDVEPEKADSMP